jgi:ribosomal protein S18 acetylase RimI-like enzyme
VTEATWAALEEAALAAWPALETTQHEGWRLRSALGYTQRANSANATPNATPLTSASLAEIERYYRDRALPTIFRLPSFCTPAGTHEWLEAQGYRPKDPSLVMHQPLATTTEAGAPAGGQGLGQGWQLLPNAATWLPVFHALSGHHGRDPALHLCLLQAITHPCAWAVWHQQGEPAACGLAVLVEGQLGLFDLITAPALRRQGLARRLCHGLLAWGRAQGAQVAYLQVLEANRAAQALYRELGFETAYAYSYRVRP